MKRFMFSICLWFPFILFGSLAQGLPANGGQEHGHSVEAPGVEGPWSVGVRTVKIGNLDVEVWYPAKDRPDGIAKRVYDLRNHLPDGEAQKIPDDAKPFQECDCYEGVAADIDHGPFPVVMFVHGTASFRTQNLSQMVHWASRGFIVMSADHPRIRLKDVLGPLGTVSIVMANQKGDLRQMINAVQANHEALNFMEGAYDQGAIGLVGHSAGSSAIAAFMDEPGVKVLIPMAGWKAKVGQSRASILYIAGGKDGITSYSGSVDAYRVSKPSKRFVGILDAGHLGMTDLCGIQQEQGGMLDVADRYGVNVPSIVRTLGKDGCGEGYSALDDARAIVNYTTTAVLEEGLKGSLDAKAALVQLPDHLKSLVEYEQQTE